MSTVAEIEEAIQRLTPEEREVLEGRILGHRLLGGMDGVERAELMASLDEAERDIEEGRSHSAEQMRSSVRSWSGG
ncbi:MAG: hypothetical protein ACOYMS_07435 [Terrimicrobiaceae bacterium]